MSDEIDEEHPDYSKHLTDVMKRVGEDVRKIHFAAEKPIIYVKYGWLVQEFKDGRIEKIKRLVS